MWLLSPICARRRHKSKTTIIGSVIALVLFYLMLLPPKGEWYPKHLQHNTLWRPNKTYVHRFENIRENVNRKHLILFWTEWFKRSTWGLGDESNQKQVLASCKVKDCVFTSDHSKIKEADALLFHLPESYDSLEDYPEYRHPDQIWIVENHEPTGHIRHDFRHLGGVFNWTMTHRRNSDVYVPYGRLKTKQLHHVDKTMNSPPDIAKTKKYGVLWASSNCYDQAMRQMIVHELEKYIHVTRFGHCNPERNIEHFERVDFETFKFYLAFENGYCEDYITEKFWRSLKEKQIPVVVGVADYKSVAPPHSYIDVLDFRSIRDLAEYLNYLDRNDTAYNSYFEWRNHFEIEEVRMEDLRFCDLCAALHEPRVHQTYVDIDGYLMEDVCLRYGEEHTLIRGLRRFLIKHNIL